ncbi:MAG: terminase family protein [Candidatus Peribacteraceae bacterium]|nr:terminase family protein [Candidatus Peribacteraceae bacterium]
MAKIDKQALEYAKKFLEYKNDPVLFAESCCYIPAPGGDELIELYDPQKRVLDAFFDTHQLILLKSRQTGFSTLSQVICTYISVFYDNCVIGVVSRSGDESSDFCRKVEDMIDKLPEWLRPKFTNKSIQYYILDSGTKLHTAAISPSNPGAVFRGKAITVLIIDEAAHAPKIDEAWTAIAPALSKSQLTARKGNIPFGTIVLSTPNRKDGIGKWFFDMWQGAKKGDNAFSPHEIYWKEVPDFVNDPNWYGEQCKLLNNDPRRIAQELELKFIGADNTLFPEHIQMALQDKSKINEGNIIERISFGKNNELHRYTKLDRRQFYLIGVDTASEGGGSDYSGVEVFDYKTMSQILEFRGKLAVKRFADVVKTIAKLLPHNIIVIENNSYGNQVIEELMYDEEFHYNLFGTYKPGKMGSKVFVPGLNTNVQTRPLIADAVYHYILNNPTCVKSERLASELMTLTDKANKIEAEAGSNDDLAMSLGFICYVRQWENDILGNTEPIDERDDAVTVYAPEAAGAIAGYNDPQTPLGHAFRDAESFGMFKKTMEAHIMKNLPPQGGVIDTFKLWQKGDGNIFDVDDILDMNKDDD